VFEQLGITKIGTYCAGNTGRDSSRLSRSTATDYQETGLAHVVIIGVSTGGLPAAYDLRITLGKQHQITVISNSDAFLFVPPNPWVAVGWRSRQDSTFELAPYLSKKNIAFIPMAAQGIKPDDNQVILVDGRVVDYDYLVIATGPKLAFEEVDGLGTRGYTHSVCTLTMRKRPLAPGRNSSRTRITSGRRSADGLLFRTGL
jgi:NADPH-dependent 2,4-dienoyl-CoA reductase/sulfur reductase-like enzyme